MSLAARCPACGTVFRVVEDQLRVSDGWVRCGRCSEVFNAIQALVEIEVPEPPPPSPHSERVIEDLARVAAASASQHEAETAPRPAAVARRLRAVPPPDPVQHDAGPDTAAPMIDLHVENGDEPPPDSRADARVEPRSEPERRARPIAGLRPEARPEHGPESGSDSRSESRAEAGTDRRAESRAEPGADRHAEPRSRPRTSARSPASPRTELRAEPDLRAEAPQPPAFVRRAERAARWRRPGVRAALSALALLATITLAAQAVFEYRDLVASRWPASRPLLEQGCALAGCSVGAPRAIEALAVDSSGLVRIRGTSMYRLSVVLKNRSPLALAVPALDLTLTDAQGGVVARRVVAPVDIGVQATSVPASRELPLQATLSTGDRPVSGYTIEIFYP